MIFFLGQGGLLTILAFFFSKTILALTWSRQCIIVNEVYKYKG